MRQLGLKPAQLQSKRNEFGVKDDNSQHNGDSPADIDFVSPVSKSLAPDTKESNNNFTLNYQPAEAFATNTSVVELYRPDGMLMKIHICNEHRHWQHIAPRGAYRLT